MTQKSVVISGAGIAGLTAAWHLSKQGWRVTVLEKANNLRAGGYLMSLSGTGYKVAEMMGILPILKKCHTVAIESYCYNRKGKKLWSLSYGKAFEGLDWITLARTDLIRIIHDALPDSVDIQFGKSPTKIDTFGNNAIVEVSDKSILQADLFIGADGLRSSARKMIFKDDKNFIEPIGYKCAAFTAPNTLNLGHKFLSFAEPKKVVEFYTLANDTIASLFIWKSADPSRLSSRDTKVELLKVFKNSHANVIAAIKAQSDETEMYADNLEMVNAPKWSSGRALIMGDAAHCLTLFSGQGAGMAMTSAWLLAQTLETNNIDDALVEHEQRFRPLITRLQKLTRKIAKTYVPSNAVSFWLRNLMFRLMPASWIGAYLRKSIQDQVEEASRGLDI